MKKLVALVLAMAMVLSCMAFAVADESEPIHLTFWHHRGSGAQYDCVTHAVEGFNNTVGKEKGIVVEESYIGGYVDLFAKIQLAVQAGEAPNITSAANTYVAYMLEDGYLADLTPLAEAEGYDLTGNFMDWLLEIGGNTDGEIHSVPYCRSTPLFYYNKDIADELGIEIPMQPTIEDLEAFGKAAMKKDDNGNVTRFGFELFNDFGYYNAAWIYELGSNYMVEDASGCPALDDGVMLKVLSDWRRWVDEGWCRVFDATNAGDTAQAMLLSGELASYVNSSAGLGNLKKACDEAGVNLGVAMFPTYNPEHPVSEIGGANLTVISADNSEEEIQASWEFVKYILTDEEQFYNAKVSGYAPCVKSIATNPEMVAFWDESPEFKVAFDQLLDHGRGQETPFVPQMQDFTQICWDNVSRLIAEKSITPEEAVANIKAESDDLW